MGTIRRNREFIDTFAYDLHKDIITKGEAFDEEAINLSIENILSTIRGERVFLLPFGSNLPLQIFETVNESNGEQILDDVLDAITLWEDRITILRDRASMDSILDSNTLILKIPYIINDANITSSFERRIII